MTNTVQHRKHRKQDEPPRVNIGNVKNVFQRYVTSEVKDKFNVNVGNAANSLSKGNTRQAFSNVKKVLANKVATKVFDKYGVNVSQPLNAIARGNSVKQITNSVRQPVANILVAEIQKRAKPQSVAYGGKSQCKKKTTNTKK